MDYSPDVEVRKFALENLARSYFANREFSKAKEMMEQAGFYGSYHYAVYLALSGYIDKGISIVIDLCRTKPSYYAIAVTDQDMKPIQAELINALDALALSENEKAVKELKKAKEEYNKALGEIAPENKIHIEEEIASLQEALQSSQKWIDAKNYSDSIRAIKTCTAISSICLHLLELSSMKSNLSEVDKDCKFKKEGYDKAQEWLRREEDDYFREETYINEKRKSTEHFAEEKMKPALGCALPVIILIIAFFKGCGNIMNDNYEEQNKIFKSWWGGIKWAFLCFIAGFILSWIVKLISRTMKHSVSKSLINAREDKIAKEISYDIVAKKWNEYNNVLLCLQTNLDKSWNEIKECLASDTKIR